MLHQCTKFDKDINILVLSYEFLCSNIHLQTDRKLNILEHAFTEAYSLFVFRESNPEVCDRF